VITTLAAAYSEPTMEAPPSPPLQFPDLPKVELDQLIEQLVDRARDVQRSQGRLRALLRAIETVTSDLALEAVLRHVVEAACELADARSGALGVNGYDGELEQFIDAGMAADVAELLKRSAGTGGPPPGAPPTDSFLGVPVRVRGEVFGTLYLIDSKTGAFTAEDEELVRALALAAGTAIHNGRLLAESRLQQRWLTASVEISAQLLAAVGEDPLHLIARRALELADADLATVGLLTADAGEMVIEVALGSGAEALLGERFPVAGTVVGKAIEGRTTVLVSSVAADPRHPDAFVGIDRGPLMALPLEGPAGVRGLLAVARRTGKRPFSGADLSMAAAFASHANVALELADARSGEQRLVLLEDRERIARDLHDHVIQELFAIGLGVDSVAGLVGPDTVPAKRLRQRVADIDRTIRQIRTTIFELRGPLDASSQGLRHRTLEIASDLASALGFTPRMEFSGLLDLSLSAEVADDVAAVVREVLTNVAKHAHASQVDVTLATSATEVLVVISDDGIGYHPSGRASGLANLRVRAESHGGSLEIAAGPNSGTTVTWKARLT
jgi:two-component system, NarL family, sensor histidine kinase DevS